MSMYTSLTGLNGAQTELSTISNNIANVGAYGFKRSRAEFADIIATSSLQNPSRVYGSGTALKTIRQQFTQGAIQSSLNVLDMAVSGQGFFTVKPKLATSEVQFTRNGSFTVDNQRFVVDSSGQALQVFPVNQDGTVLASSLQETRSLRLPETSGQPRNTDLIQTAANLSSTAEIIPNNPRYSATSPYVFDRNNPTTFNHTSSLTVYDSLGNPQAAEIYYVRQTAATATSPTSDWQMHVFVGGTELTLPSAAPATLTFNANGQLAASSTPITFAPFTPASGDPITLTLDHGLQTSQYSDPFSVFSLSQNGYAAGQLDNISIDVGGVVRASFTNGETTALGKIALASFANNTGLKQMGDAHYTSTALSGVPQMGQAGSGGYGTVLSGSLERSNVDITEELVNLITAQRNFQANAKAIETDSAMTQSIINIRS
jgi:flagellar hook protein FlgE